MAQKTPRGAAQRFFRELICATNHPQECIYWPYARNENGYGVFGKKRGKIGSALVSRVVCSEVNGLPTSGEYEAAHTCGNGHNGCVNPRHLVWKTSKQNKEDQLSHGTRNRGERNGQSRLTADQVRQIRSLVKTTSQSAVAEKFGVDQSHISNIVRGKQWGHVQ